MSIYLSDVAYTKSPVRMSYRNRFLSGSSYSKHNYLKRNSSAAKNIGMPVPGAYRKL